MAFLDGLARRLLFRLDPETAHWLAIRALKRGLVQAKPAPPDPRLAVTAAGVRFPNPLGMAAGFDKNGEVPDPLLALGFGFAEVGTVTPRPQEGNPRPRVFRLEREHAVINRLGFNNQGLNACAQKLERRAAKSGVVGVNIGANKDSTERISDYESGVKRFAGLASYLTVNISSPNTPGLRDLQARENLAELLSRVTGARRGLSGAAAKTPIFLKIAPDLDEKGLEDVAAEVSANDIDGVIVSNTTLSRPFLHAAQHAEEAGGLSGRPLFERSTAVLARMRLLLGAERTVIGVGGVESAGSALEKIRAGADLVQLYSGFVFGGPSLPVRILGGMSAALDRDGHAGLHALRGSRTAFWAAKTL